MLSTSLCACDNTRYKVAVSPWTLRNLFVKSAFQFWIQHTYKHTPLSTDCMLTRQGFFMPITFVCNLFLKCCFHVLIFKTLGSFNDLDTELFKAICIHILFLLVIYFSCCRLEKAKHEIGAAKQEQIYWYETALKTQ